LADRIGDVLEDINDTTDAINKPEAITPIEYVIGVAEPLSNAVSDALDFVVLIGTVLKKPKLSVWADYWCSALWLFAIIWEVRRALKIIMAKPDIDGSVEEFDWFKSNQFYCGYVALLKGACDTILGLSSLSPRIDGMTTMVNWSGLGGGLCGLAISLHKRLHQKEALI
jgi:hypothetical protein